MYYEIEFYLYGEVYIDGGKKPNIHITTEEYGSLTVSAKKEQIKDGEQKTYKQYGIKVRGKRNLENNSVKNLELIEFIPYDPSLNKLLLDKAIEKASKNLSKIKDVDACLTDISDV